MASLVSGIYDLSSGDPTQKQEGALSDLYKYELGLGEKSTSQGLGWESDILSGDPAKMAMALAPEIKSGQDMVQQQAMQNATFGNRGGGTNSSTNAAQSGERGNIISLEGGLQSGAASALTGAGENLLTQGSSNVMNSANLALENRQRQVGDVGGIAQGAAEIAAPFLTGMATGADPYSTLYGAQHPDRGSISTSSDYGDFTIS
jgi:hypothetical protein